MERDLGKLRQEIDAIDRQMVALFRERLAICAEVEGYKRLHGLPIHDAGREASLLSKVGALAGEETADYVKALYSCVFAVSRSYQNSRRGREGDALREIRQALDSISTEE